MSSLPLIIPAPISLCSPSSIPSSLPSETTSSAPATPIFTDSAVSSSLPSLLLSPTVCSSDRLVELPSGPAGVVFRVVVGEDHVVDVGKQEQVCIVGNCQVVGNWNVQKALKLQLWWKTCLQTPLPSSSSLPTAPTTWVSPTIYMKGDSLQRLEFKCVIFKPIDEHFTIFWETFGTNVFDNRRVVDVWKGDELSSQDVCVLKMQLGKKQMSMDRVRLPGHHMFPSFSNFSTHKLSPSLSCLWTVAGSSFTLEKRLKIEKALHVIKREEYYGFDIPCGANKAKTEVDKPDKEEEQPIAVPSLPRRWCFCLRRKIKKLNNEGNEYTDTADIDKDELKVEKQEGKKTTVVAVEEFLKEKTVNLSKQTQPLLLTANKYHTVDTLTRITRVSASAVSYGCVVAVAGTALIVGMWLYDKSAVV